MGESVSFLGFRKFKPEVIKQLFLSVGEASENDAIFNLKINGVEQFSGNDRPKITAGQTTLIKGGLNIPVAEFDVVTLDLVSGEAKKPIDWGTEFEGEGGQAELPAGDLNAAQNKLEKIQGRDIEIAPSTLAFLADDFNDNSLNTDIWEIISEFEQTTGDEGEPNQGTRAYERNNRFEIILGYATNGIRTKNAFDFTGKSLSFDILQFANGNGHANNCYFRDGLGNNMFVHFSPASGSALFRVNINGVNQQSSIGFFAAEKVRIYHDTEEDKIIIETFYEGQWTTQLAANRNGWNLQALKLSFESDSYYESGYGIKIFAFDNLQSNIVLSGTDLEDRTLFGRWNQAQNRFETFPESEIILPNGDLNRLTNRLEKLQGKTVEPFLVIPPVGSNFPGDSLDDEGFWELWSGNPSDFTIADNSITAINQFVLRAVSTFTFLDGDEIALRMEAPSANQTTLAIKDTAGNDQIALSMIYDKRYVYTNHDTYDYGTFNPATDKWWKLKRDGTDLIVSRSADGEDWIEVGTIALHSSYINVFEAGIRLFLRGYPGTIFSNFETTLGDYDQSVETNIYVFNPLTQKHEPKKIEDFAEILKPYLDALP